MPLTFKGFTRHPPAEPGAMGQAAGLAAAHENKLRESSYAISAIRAQCPEWGIFPVGVEYFPIIFPSPQPYRNMTYIPKVLKFLHRHLQT